MFTHTHPRINPSKRSDRDHRVLDWVPAGSDIDFYVHRFAERDPVDVDDRADRLVEAFRTVLCVARYGEARIVGGDGRRTPGAGAGGGPRSIRLRTPGNTVTPMRVRR